MSKKKRDHPLYLGGCWRCGSWFYRDVVLFNSIFPFFFLFSFYYGHSSDWWHTSRQPKAIRSWWIAALLNTCVSFLFFMNYIKIYIYYTHLSISFVLDIQTIYWAAGCSWFGRVKLKWIVGNIFDSKVFYSISWVVVFCIWIELTKDFFVFYFVCFF